MRREKPEKNKIKTLFTSRKAGFVILVLFSDLISLQMFSGFNADCSWQQVHKPKALILQLFFRELSPLRAFRCPVQVRVEQNRIQKKVDLEGRAAVCEEVSWPFHPL